jgi:hypothetical protein
MAVTVPNAIVLSANKTMNNVVITDNQLNPNGYWDKPVAKLLFIPTSDDLSLFDQNGYDLTELEKHYASSNIAGADSHRCHRTALKQSWFTQGVAIEGAHLNHSLLFERKAYSGAALEQLKRWATALPLIHKLIAIRAKWGLDFSIDWVDREGNTFEILHWEYDGFDYEEIAAVKAEVEPVLINIDWHDAARQLIKQKHKWHHLDFFAQSDWKCNYFGVAKERFKMVIWK